MLISIDLTSSIPLADQIAAHIRSLVDLARRAGLDEQEVHTAISRAFGTTLQPTRETIAHTFVTSDR